MKVLKSQLQAVQAQAEAAKASAMSALAKVSASDAESAELARLKAAAAAAGGKLAAETAAKDGELLDTRSLSRTHTQTSPSMFWKKA